MEGSRRWNGGNYNCRWSFIGGGLSGYSVFFLFCTFEKWLKRNRVIVILLRVIRSELSVCCIPLEL